MYFKNALKNHHGFNILMGILCSRGHSNVLGLNGWQKSGERIEDIFIAIGKSSLP